MNCENCGQPLTQNQAGYQPRCMQCGVSIDSRNGKALRVGNTNEFYFKGGKMFGRKVDIEEQKPE